MERETGIEPATNSLEGCDSTTELLPPARLATALPSLSLTPPKSQTLPGSFPQPAPECAPSAHSKNHCLTNFGLASLVARKATTKLVGRGGFEPP